MDNNHRESVEARCQGGYQAVQGQAAGSSTAGRPGDEESQDMSASFKILYLFVSPQGWLAEVKRLDLAADAPKDRVYQWLWISTARVMPLRFVSMGTAPRQQREFEEASLWFDAKGGALTWHDGATVTLDIQDDKTLPSLQEHLLQAYLGMA